MNYRSKFVTPEETYSLQVTPYTCSKFGLAEFFATYLEDIGNWKEKKVLDVGCGVGPLSIVLADKEKCNVLGIDLNPQAINCFKKNIQNYKLSDKIAVRLSNFSECVQNDLKNERWDAIVSNPPIIDELPQEIIDKYKFDDFSKLSKESFLFLTNSWRNKDGKDLLEKIFSYSATNLNSHGMLCVIYCSMSNVLPSVLIERARHFELIFRRMIEGTIPAESLGIRNGGISKVTAYILVFRNEN